MRSILFASTTALLLTAAACSNTPPPNSTGTGGSSNSGGSTGTGGTSSGTGGSSNSGGSTGTGGTSSGTGGSSTGGFTGAGGSDTGGSTGSGGISPTGAGGDSTGTGGASTGGVGGQSAGTGGSKTGTGGAGATAGASGGALCSNGDCSSIVGKWDGALDEFPCSSKSSDGYDCPNACPAGGGKTTTFTYPISGTAGTIYDVTLEAKGVVEVYPYQNTTFPTTYTNPIKGNGAVNNLFSIGGTQAASGNGNDYNTYEIQVSPAVAGLTNVAGNPPHNVYYLNGVPANETPHNGPTTHLTFCIDDIATIKVPAGGTVTLQSFDSNCVQVENCGSTRGSTCSAPQSVSLAGAVPFDSTVMSFSQAQPWQTSTGYGQWIFFDIKNVTVAQ